MTVNNRILIVDDERNILDGYRRTLRDRYQIDLASGGGEALQMVEASGPYAVVIADMQMPGMNGMELLARLKEVSPDTVRMMVTGNTDQQTAIDAVNKGQVYRFLNKPCNRSELSAALNDALARHEATRDERERAARSAADVDVLKQRLSFEARHDLLTGLSNRRAFEDGLRQCMSTSLGQGRQHALCYLDLDDFHVVNDTCGHVAGDSMLRAIGNLLSGKCRLGDMAGRMAGEEFALLLLDCSLERATRIVEEFFQGLEEMAFEWEDQRLDIRARAGLVMITDPGHDALSLLGMAETACNVAGDPGQGRLHVAGPDDELLSGRLSRAQWVTRIGRALREDSFRLFCQRIQPIVPGVGGDHCELLIRMLDQDGGILPPGLFLDTAERYRLSSQIDQWVIRSATDWWSAHPEHLDRLSLCSINLSGHSVGDPEIFALIRDTLATSIVPTEKICFEITETAAIARMSTAVHFIRDLKKLGFRFALDDFGAGLSSFGYLKNLPVDYLKIDGMFVSHIDTDEVDRAMVRCINEVAKVLGIKTIAEYVENAQILAVLAKLGIDYAQGYHIARPFPLDELR